MKEETRTQKTCVLPKVIVKDCKGHGGTGLKPKPSRFHRLPLAASSKGLPQSLACGIVHLVVPNLGR